MSKFPSDAKRVYKGSIYEVYEWQQKLYDGSITTFEGLKRVDTAIVVPVTPDGLILTVEDEQPHREKVLTLPGGRVDKGEDPLEGAKRELLEETGYSSNSWEVWKEINPGEKIEYTIHYYVARNVVKTAQPDPGPGEKINLRPVTPEQFFEDVVSGKHNAFELGVHIMQQLLQGKREELIKFLKGS